MKITQRQLAELVSKKFGKSVSAVDDTITYIKEEIIEQLAKGNTIQLVGFGKFLTMVRHERGGVDPQKPGERITIPEVRVAKFKVGSTFKKLIKNTKH